ncbi:MAG: GumC family protein [Pseudochelatococcus sp.]|uniref:GumC family protein n=1 Tax=Pseudochelatococcus sp. TaxID=2020869 RepID=UPI003D936DD8
MSDIRPAPGDAPLARRLEELSTISMRDLVFIASKWLREFLVVVVAIVALTLAYIALLRTPLYESEARLFVRLSQEQQPPRTLLTPTGSTLIAPATSDVTSEIDLLLNADIAQRVIRDINLEAQVTPRQPESFTDYIKAAVGSVARLARSGVDNLLYATGMKVPMTLNEALARQVRSSLQVQNTRTSNVVVVSFRWPDREVPQALLSKYIDTFLQFRLEAFQEGDASFFERLRNTSAEKLAGVETEIAALRRRAGIEDVDAQRKLLLTELSQAETAEREAALRLTTTRERLAAVEKRGLAGGPLVLANLPDHALLGLLDEQSVAVARERLRVAALPRIDGHELAALDESYASLTQATVRALSDYADQIAAIRSNAAARVALVRARFARLSENEPRWNQLQIDRRLAENELQHNAERLAEAISARELRRERLGNIVVIQEPTEATLAVGTRNITVMVLGVVFAVFAGGAWVAVREFLDSRVWRGRDLAAAGAPVLVSLGRRRNGPGRDELAPAAVTLRQSFAQGEPRSIVCMALRDEPSHAATQAAARVRALALALRDQGEKSVRIINAGRWPAGGKAGAAGLAELDVPTDTGGLERVAAAAEGRDGFDGITLIATGPLFSGPIPLRAAQTAGGVVLDVAAGRDELAQVREVVSWIDRNGGLALGLVLTQTPRLAKEA